MGYAVDHSGIVFPDEVDLEPRHDNVDLSLLQSKLSDQEWRLNNLYKIVDQDGDIVTFRMNWAQKQFYRSIWYQNVILKARQLGFSTFIDLYILDTCLFQPNISAAVIAHGQREASDLFQKKILFAYNNLPDVIRQWRPATKKSKTAIEFSNGSSIIVTVSARSGTYQILHVSEFGKICAKYPQRADEVVSGSLQAVHQGNLVFIESTAEGREGHFYRMCEESQRLVLMGKSPTSMQSRFHFFAWHENPTYRLPLEEVSKVTIPKRVIDYFIKLEDEYGIDLDPQQRAWYVLKESALGDLMKREHPSYPAEAFEARLEGAIWGEQISLMRSERRVCDLPVNPSYPVQTWWDIGISDYMVVIWVQTIGGRIHLVDWHMDHNKSIEHFSKIVQAWKTEHKIIYSEHLAPHDVGQRDAFFPGAVTRLQFAQETYGLQFRRVANPGAGGKQTGIDLVRRLFPMIYADETKCGDLIDLLSQYQREWDVNLGAYKDTPRHDEPSHPADAVRTGLMVHPFAARLSYGTPSSPQTPSIGRKR